MLSKGNDPYLHFCPHCGYATKQNPKVSEEQVMSNNTNETETNKQITYSPGPPVQEGKTPIHITWETYERLRKNGPGIPGSTWDDTISKILDVYEKFNKRSTEKDLYK